MSYAEYMKSLTAYSKQILDAININQLPPALTGVTFTASVTSGSVALPVTAFFVGTGLGMYGGYQLGDKVLGPIAAKVVDHGQSVARTKPKGA